jgi:hypothetical protein
MTMGWLWVKVKLAPTVTGCFSTSAKFIPRIRTNLIEEFFNTSDRVESMAGKYQVWFWYLMSKGVMVSWFCCPIIICIRNIYICKCKCNNCIYICRTLL